MRLEHNSKIALIIFSTLFCDICLAKVTENWIKKPFQTDNREIIHSEDEGSKSLRKEPTEALLPIESAEPSTKSGSKKKDLNIITDSIEGTLKNDDKHPPIMKGFIPDWDNVSGFTEFGAILFLLSLFVVFFIMHRACKMKHTRGERKYGGVTTSYHELAPITIEDDDSETEDQALFDLQQVRASQAVL